MADRDPCPRPPEQHLRELYHGRKLSTTEIASLLEVNSRSVSNWLRHYKIERRSISEAIRLAYQKERIQKVPLTPEQKQACGQRIRKWRLEHKEKQRQLGQTRAKDLQRLWALRHGPIHAPCAWCGSPCLHKRCRALKPPRYCNHSHAALGMQWRRWHPGEPRPLILALLQEGRAPREVGAEKAETAALLPAPLPIRRVMGPSPRKKKRALTEEKIGPLGEALLRAQKEQKKGNHDGQHS